MRRGPSFPRHLETTFKRDTTIHHMLAQRAQIHRVLDNAESAYAGERRSIADAVADALVVHGRVARYRLGKQ